MERSEFDAARGLDEGINGKRQQDKQYPPIAVTDLIRRPVDEDPAITARATAAVKAKIAARRSKPRLVLPPRPGSSP